MRYPIALAAFVALLASGGRHVAQSQTPERLVLDSGTTVRVRPDGKPSIEGYLLASYGPENDSLRMCATARGSRCVDSTATDIHRFAARELKSVSKGLIGKHVEGWIPLFPCPVHGQCAWPPGANRQTRGVR
jgi:hypothetical protein